MLQQGTRLPYEIENLVVQTIESTWPADAGLESALHAARVGASVAWAQKRSYWNWPVVAAYVTWLGFVAFMIYMLWRN